LFRAPVLQPEDAGGHIGRNMLGDIRLGDRALKVERLFAKERITDRPSVKGLLYAIV
jgi:hypothetical protein